MPRLTKKQAERIHSKRRAYERYGLEIRKADIQKAVRAIQAGKAWSWPAFSGSRRTSGWVLLMQDTLVYVVYDNQRKELVTFLPPNNCVLACVNELPKVEPWDFQGMQDDADKLYAQMKAEGRVP